MADSEMQARQTYLDRIERVRAHIRADLDAPLDLDALAEVACMSRFHWHRIYQAMSGETTAQTVRRLRLARAAEDLAPGSYTHPTLPTNRGVENTVVCRSLNKKKQHTKRKSIAIR